MYMGTTNKRWRWRGSSRDWVVERSSRLSDEQMQAMLQTEQGGMNEALANLYGLTGEEKYLEMSLRFNHHRVVDPWKRERIG